MFTKIYCQDLFLLFFLADIFIVAYSVLNFVFKNYKILRAIGFLGATISLLGILSFTVFGREVATYNIEFRPFYSFVMAKTQHEYYRTVFMNSLLFVPFGTFLPYLLSSKYRKSNVAVTVIISFAVSTIIEGLQYICAIGVCEIDDVIFNTLGAFIGALGYLLFGHLTKERKV